MHIKLFLLLTSMLSLVYSKDNTDNFRNHLYDTNGNNVFYKALTRTRRASDDDNYIDSKYYEITDNGMIFRGGIGLPADFKGSGNPDFAFEGESFRDLYRQPIRKIVKIDNDITPEPTIQKSSTYPNNCQFRCHQYITTEYNPICGSDGVTYYNPGKFKCANKCGKQITGRPYVTCGFGSMTV